MEYMRIVCWYSDKMSSITNLPTSLADNTNTKSMHGTYPYRYRQQALLTNQQRQAFCLVEMGAYPFAANSMPKASTLCFSSAHGALTTVVYTHESHFLSD